MTPSRIAKLAQIQIERAYLLLRCCEAGQQAPRLVRACNIRHIIEPALSSLGARGRSDEAGRRDVFTRPGLAPEIQTLFLVAEAGAALAGVETRERLPSLLFGVWLLCGEDPLLTDPRVPTAELFALLAREDPKFAAHVVPLLRDGFEVLATLGPSTRPYPGDSPPDMGSPDVFAYALGRHARAYGQYGDAERFFRRAIAAAERSGNHALRAAAWLALGKVFRYRGRRGDAVEILQVALDLAREARARVVFARAAHELATIAIETEDGPSAYRLALRALKAYPESDPDRARLVHDIGFLWIEQGHFVRALSVLLAIVAHVKVEGDRLLVLSNIARSAGCARSDALADQYAREVWHLAGSLPITCHSAQAYLNLAYGSLARRAWDEAWRAASLALAIAGEVGEAGVEREALPLVDAILERRVLEYRPRGQLRAAEVFATRVARAFGRAG